MVNRRLKAGEAVQILLEIVPLLSKDIEGVTIEDDSMSLSIVSGMVREAIKTESLEPILSARPWARRIIVSRIQAFAIGAQGHRQKFIGTYPTGDERQRLIAALNAIVHYSAGRERRREDRRPIR